MRIGNKNIPYPVLNQDKTLTDYKPEVEFSLTFEVQKDGNPIIENGKINFKNLKILTKLFINVQNVMHITKM